MAERLRTMTLTCARSLRALSVEAGAIRESVHPVADDPRVLLARDEVGGIGREREQRAHGAEHARMTRAAVLREEARVLVVHDAAEIAFGRYDAPIEIDVGRAKRARGAEL